MKRSIDLGEGCIDWDKIKKKKKKKLNFALCTVNQVNHKCKFLNDLLRWIFSVQQ